MLTVFLSLDVNCIPLRGLGTPVRLRITCASTPENSFQTPCLLLHACYFVLATPLTSKIKCSFSTTAIFVFQTLSQPQHPHHPHHYYSRALNSNLSTHCPIWRLLQNECISVTPSEFTSLSRTPVAKRSSWMATLTILNALRMRVDLGRQQ